MSHQEQVGIHCLNALFAKQEVEISRLSQAITQARTVGEKAPQAQALMEAVDVLLACEHYDAASVDCRLCHNFSELRRKTATLIKVAVYRNPVKAGQLGAHQR